MGVSHIVVNKGVGLYYGGRGRYWEGRISMRVYSGRVG